MTPLVPVVSKKQRREEGFYILTYLLTLARITPLTDRGGLGQQRGAYRPRAHQALLPHVAFTSALLLVRV